MSSFNDTRHPVGLKDYHCEWCGQLIPKGEKHAHFVGKWEGEFQNWRMHSDCLHFNSDEIAEGFTPFEGERPPQNGTEDAASTGTSGSLRSEAQKS